MHLKFVLLFVCFVLFFSIILLLCIALGTIVVEMRFKMPCIIIIIIIESRPIIHIFAAKYFGSEVSLNVFKVLNVSDLCWVPHWTAVFELTSDKRFVQ